MPELLAGRGSLEPSIQRTTSAGAKRAREASSHEADIPSRRCSCEVTTGPLEDPAAGPLVAVEQYHIRDRDVGVLRGAVAGQTAQSTHATAQRAQALARPLDGQTEAAHRVGPLRLPIASGEDEENLAYNRFGGDEFCQSCAQPHADSNYVATDANGISYCGAC